MSDYSITKKTGTYPTGLPEIKVGEYEETQIIYGEDCLTEIVERLRLLEKHQQDNDAGEAADTIEALRAENARLRAHVKAAYYEGYGDRHTLGDTDDADDTSGWALSAARAAMGERQ